MRSIPIRYLTLILSLKYHSAVWSSVFNSDNLLISLFSVSHIYGNGAAAWGRAAGATKEKEAVCRRGGQSTDEEPGVSRQLHARGWSRAPRPQTRGEYMNK